MMGYKIRSGEPSAAVANSRFVLAFRGGGGFVAHPTDTKSWVLIPMCKSRASFASP